MYTFKVESRNEKDALLEKFTVVASNLDEALELARTDQQKQWKSEDVRITSIVETSERVVAARPVTARGRSSRG